MALLAGSVILPGALAQTDNCTALRAQTDTLVQSYAATAAGLASRLEAYDAASQALAGVYDGQSTRVELYEAIAAGTLEGSPSDILGAEDGRLDDAAMRESAAALIAAIEGVNVHLDTLAVQKPAMEAALGILQDQCAEAEVAPASPAAVTAAAAPAGNNPAAGPIPIVFTNFWKHEASGRIYEGRGQDFYRDDKLAVKLSCDGFGTVREQPGKLCEGEWFDQSGKRGGDFRAVHIVNADTKLPMLQGELTTPSNPDSWAPWDFYEMTREQAEAAGLVDVAP
ncbi:hypothetical protein [Henriciella mobilis]|uniref:hypothetical protein n=1 Tax=Henriciella mobilis TaxID=2305467 RepID=UPI001F3A9088|nr:hypothetical protein [Henriciella mobilis]